MAKFMTAKEAAERYGVHYRTLLRWVKTGEIKAVRFGKAILITESEAKKAENKAKVGGE